MVKPDTEHPAAIAVVPATEALAKEIEARLTEALRANTPPNDVAPLAVVAHDNDGTLIAGLTGTMAYGWLLVKTLWVAETERGRGLGARMMAKAEAEAFTQGCHHAWLDTSSERAEGFYRRLGYELFGALDNGRELWPPGHRRTFMKKRLLA
ncbi:GNAT family N-acetyltransferase [Sphingopyxis sp.]|uniref:GNAT family N-acetyltransferase n=1 Tax=Sphingopyxis sp. TaxID=1908224 RepID=UPI003F70C066